MHGKFVHQGRVERSFQETHIVSSVAGDGTVLKGHCATSDAKATPLCIKERCSRFVSAWKVRSTGEVLNALSRKGQKASALIREKRNVRFPASKEGRARKVSSGKSRSTGEG